MDHCCLQIPFLTFQRQLKATLKWRHALTVSSACCSTAPIRSTGNNLIVPCSLFPCSEDVCPGGGLHPWIGYLSSAGDGRRSWSGWLSWSPDSLGGRPPTAVCPKLIDSCLRGGCDTCVTGRGCDVQKAHLDPPHTILRHVVPEQSTSQYYSIHLFHATVWRRPSALFQH